MRTIGIGPEVGHDIADSNVNDTEEALILLFKFLLVENLYGKNAALVRSAKDRSGELCLSLMHLRPCREA